MKKKIRAYGVKRNAEPRPPATGNNVMLPSLVGPGSQSTGNLRYASVPPRTYRGFRISESSSTSEEDQSELEDSDPAATRGDEDEPDLTRDHKQEVEDDLLITDFVPADISHQQVAILSFDSPDEPLQT